MDFQNLLNNLLFRLHKLYQVFCCKFVLDYCLLHSNQVESFPPGILPKGICHTQKEGLILQLYQNLNTVPMNR